jgi:hypothetical protein
LEDPFNFNPGLVVDLVAQQIQARPVYLASLSNEFYNAAELLELYCIVPELNFYRVFPSDQETGGTCLTG